MRFFNCFILAILFHSISAFAQDKDPISSFTTVSLTYKTNTKWFANFEVQARAISEFDKIDYYEIKGGLGYSFNSKNQSSVGLGRYANYSDGKLSRTEIRIWAQHLYSKFISKLKIEQRFRLEKRFFYNPVTSTNTNSERFRYRLNLILPINHKKIEEKTFFVNTYNELFVTIDKPIISRNRLYLGGGYQLNTAFGFSLGYLLQRDFGTSNTTTNFIFSGFTFTISPKNKISSPIETLNAD